MHDCEIAAVLSESGDLDDIELNEPDELDFEHITDAREILESFDVEPSM
jgi:hypothetical protein